MIVNYWNVPILIGVMWYIMMLLLLLVLIYKQVVLRKEDSTIMFPVIFIPRTVSL